MKKLILILLLASCQPQQKQIVKGYIVKKQIVKNIKGDPIYVTTISVNGSLVNYYGINYYMMEEGDTIEITNK
jgi:hypothetical protein